MTTGHRLLLTIAAVGLGLSLAEAQQPKKVPRVGFLCTGRCSGPSQDGFQQGLRELGYVEGKNIIIEYRHAEGKADRLSALAAELVRLKVDVIIPTGGRVSLDAVENVTKTIPIVIVTSSADPVSQGLIGSLARPGGNITGIAQFAELPGKRLELLKETVPGLSRVGIFWDANSAPRVSRKELEKAARLLKLRLLPFELRDSNDFDAAFETTVKERAGALHVAGTPLFLSGTRQKRLVELTIKHRLPTISMWSNFAEGGGLMAYGPSRFHMYRRAAYFVDKILKGAKPADLPVEQPTKFELVINLKTAKKLGLKIPPHLLMEADKVIE